MAAIAPTITEVPVNIYSPYGEEYADISYWNITYDADFSNVTSDLTVNAIWNLN
jgi:hypothetical protein